MLPRLSCDSQLGMCAHLSDISGACLWITELITHMQSAVAMSVHATATVIRQALELERHSLGFVEKPGLNQAG